MSTNWVYVVAWGTEMQTKKISLFVDFTVLFREHGYKSLWGTEIFCHKTNILVEKFQPRWNQGKNHEKLFEWNHVKALLI